MLEPQAECQVTRQVTQGCKGGVEPHIRAESERSAPTKSRCLEQPISRDVWAKCFSGQQIKFSPRERG